jgi:hypothetical protein
MFNIKKAERRECKERTYPSIYFPKGDNLLSSSPNDSTLYGRFKLETWDVKLLM